MSSLHHAEPDPIGVERLGPFPTPRPLGEQGALEDLLASASCDVRLAGAYRFVGAWDVPTRITPHYILCVGISGQAQVTVGSARYLLAPQALVLTPPHVPQSFTKVADEELRFYTVHFTARVHGVLDLPSLFGLASVLHVSPSDLVQFEASARRIVDELAEAQPGFMLAAGGECARMLALLWRATNDSSGTTTRHAVVSAAALAHLAPVFRAIQAHHPEPLRVRDLARLVSLHPAWFSTRFKQLTGLSPARYLTRYRLDRARELLMSTQLPIREIAALTGFQDPLYLSRQFRRVVGMSPTAYRQSVGIATKTLVP